MTENTSIEEMTKEELLEVISALTDKVDNLTHKLETKGSGRKEQVLKLIQEGYNTITDIADEIGINNKNVSSQLTYLRKEGYKIISYRLDNKTHVELRD